jgi:hypothetical protein
MKRAVHMMKTAAVSVCAVSDGRAGPSTRYICYTCRGISASARAGARSMSAWTGSKEGTLITSNDQTRSCLGISCDRATSRAGISTSTCTGAKGRRFLCQREHSQEQGDAKITRRCQREHTPRCHDFCQDREGRNFLHQLNHSHEQWDDKITHRCQRERSRRCHEFRWDRKGRSFLRQLEHSHKQ